MDGTTDGTVMLLLTHITMDGTMDGITDGTTVGAVLDQIAVHTAVGVMVFAEHAVKKAQLKQLEIALAFFKFQL